MDATTTRHAVTVTFNRDASPKFTFDPAGESRISTAFGVVTYLLTPKPLTVRFPSNPVQWIDNETNRRPIDQPKGTEVTRAPGRAAVRIDTAQAPDKLVFFLLVETEDGNFFGSDPTIVTMLPPGGGGQGG